jgi:hypothetical protein
MLLLGTAVTETRWEVYQLRSHLGHFILQGKKWYFFFFLGKITAGNDFCPREYLIPYNFQDKTFTTTFKSPEGLIYLS